MSETTSQGAASPSSTTSSVYQAYQNNTYLFGGNAPYVEEMYENYLANPGSVPDSWRDYFDALQHVPAADGSNSKDVAHQPVIDAFAQRAKAGGTNLKVGMTRYGLMVDESGVIIDYLDAKFKMKPLMPTAAKAVAHLISGNGGNKLDETVLPLFARCAVF